MSESTFGRKRQMRRIVVGLAAALVIGLTALVLSVVAFGHFKHVPTIDRNALPTPTTIYSSATCQLLAEQRVAIKRLLPTATGDLIAFLKQLDLDTAQALSKCS